MHPQLQAIVDDFGRTETRLHRLAAALPPDAWLRRPDPSRWSVGECITHLNLTAAAYIPLLQDAWWRGRALGEVAPRRRSSPGPRGPWPTPWPSSTSGSAEQVTAAAG
jgi:hypothetical protein